jgi:NAD(P)-dependent dehydrogenase (short-subunit alcohol dehydrogenase family)
MKGTRAANTAEIANDIVETEGRSSYGELMVSIGGVMSATASTIPTRPGPELLRQTVVIIGGSAGIGLETARRARAEGASIILTGRNRERLEQAARELGAERTAAFDANDPASLQSFFQDLPSPIDHVMVTAGAPHYRPPLEMSPEDAGGTGARRPGLGLAIVSTATVAFPALVANLALELAPIRVNLIAAGFVDTPLSASLLGDELEKRRDVLRATLPIGRVVGPADVAALAVHIMSNTALTGATYDIDGDQQLVS